jgi:toxin YoeB
MYTIRFSQKASRHKALLKQSHLDAKARSLLDILAENPFKSPPSFEKLVGDLKGAYSRRINHQHRLVYMVNEEQKEIFVLSMWTHYE